jgi:inner membrane protein
MPSPVGHALGGLAVGLVVSSRPEWRWLALCACAAMLPDADFLLPIRHRGPTHSIGAAAIAGATAFAWLKLSADARDAARLSLAIGTAYATHVLLDWLGADSSTPRGLMALWPFTTAFFISDLDVFSSVDRRYWLDGFWRRSATSLVRELAVLVPLVAVAWWTTRHRHGGGPVNLTEPEA